MKLEAVFSFFETTSLSSWSETDSLIYPGTLQISENTRGRQLKFFPLLEKRFKPYVLLLSGTTSSMKNITFCGPCKTVLETKVQSRMGL